MVDSTMTGTGGSLVQRMIRAARLDNGLYEEVEADRSATGQAAQAVVIVAVAGAIGQGLSVALQGQGVPGIVLAAAGAGGRLPPGVGDLVLRLPLYRHALLRRGRPTPVSCRVPSASPRPPAC